MPAVSAGRSDEFRVTRSTYAGSWLILVFYPRDFSFVCPTELIALSAQIESFEQRGAKLFGVSVDPPELHREWLQTPVDDGGLGPLRFPLASDVNGAAASAFGVWNADKQVALRGLFIIDPDGVVQYAVVHNLSVGRSPDEVLRVLKALQTDGLCPANWTSADGTIDAERALRPGRILGHYRIQRLLGRGSFATVFAARDLHLDRTVALKVLRHLATTSHSALVNEARAAAALNHRNVCTVYAVEVEDGLPLIAMEYIDGQTLRSAIDAGLDDNSADRLALGIARGLSSAHQRRIAHGDLKPTNIMIGDDGEPRILDFGLARPSAVAPPPHPERRSAVESTVITPTPPQRGEQGPTPGSAIRGTPAYMSPEQTRAQPATPASDVFAFGLMLFELWTGRRAIGADDPLNAIDEIRSTNLAHELSAKFDPPRRELLRDLLAADPQSRMTMEAVAERLAGDTAS